MSRPLHGGATLGENLRAATYRCWWDDPETATKIVDTVEAALSPAGRLRRIRRPLRLLFEDDGTLVMVEGLRG